MFAIESTSVYWKLLFNIFELRSLKYIIVNAKAYKIVQGRKTYILGSDWLEDLLRHGLLKASFTPTREQRELREATCYPKPMTDQRTRTLNKLKKCYKVQIAKLNLFFQILLVNNDERMDEKYLKH